MNDNQIQIPHSVLRHGSFFRSYLDRTNATMWIILSNDSRYPYIKAGDCKEMLTLNHRENNKSSLFNNTSLYIKTDNSLIISELQKLSREKINYHKGFVVLDKNSFWRKSAIRLEILYACLQDSKGALENNAALNRKRSIPKKFFKDLLDNIENIPVEVEFNDNFLKSRGGRGGIWSALNNEGKRKQISQFFQ